MSQKTRNRHVPLRRNASIFFIFYFVLFWGLLIGEGEREREEEEEEERETLGYGLENVNLEIFLFILYSSMLLFLSQQIDFRET